MSKITRKRKSSHHNEAPKPKFKPYDAKSRAEDAQLTKILFGDTTTFLKSLEEAEQEDFKSTPDSGLGEDDSEDSEMLYKPAWTDEDEGVDVGQALDAQNRKLPAGGINDRSNKYSDLLRHKFQAINGTPAWASLSDKKKKDDDDTLRTCGFIKNSKGPDLPGVSLEYKKMKDLNAETYLEGPCINCVDFFKNASAALVAGQSGVVSLYAVDGKKNQKLHSIGFERFPILCAKVIESNNEAILGSRQPYIYSYDLVTAKSTRINLPPEMTTCKKFVVSADRKTIAVAGKWGEIHLLASQSKERIGTLKQNGDVTSLAFSHKDGTLFSHSDSGEITIFNLTARRASHKFVDEGCLNGSTLALAPSNQFLAAGSAQGVVNVYDMKSLYESHTPKPRKALMNLTTAITSLEFNPTSELLAFASVDVLTSIKFYHVNSNSVFKNFPSFETKLGHVNSISFSPSSGFVSLGNKKSTVSLYRLNHYNNY